MSGQQMDRKALAGAAALAICESLLLALAERKVLSDGEICGVLEDAAMAHRGASGTPQELADHAVVARIIDKVRDSVT